MNETLVKWKVLQGPYLVLPIWGPSSFRGTVGLTVDWLIDPWIYIARNRHRIGNSHRQQLYLLYILYGLDSIRLRAKYRGVVDEASKSPDPYVMLRSLYYQHQKKLEQKS
jgi:phospholipid-binding lipoprotein MlaA